MQGTVQAYDSETGSGSICGDDGKFYSFKTEQVKSEIALLKQGADVDFEGSGLEAVSVYVSSSVSVPENKKNISDQKNRIVACVLAFLFGVFGIHKFYLGYKRAGIIMFAVSVIGYWFFGIHGCVIYFVAVLEGIIYICKTDDEFYDTYVAHERDWF